MRTFTVESVFSGVFSRSVTVFRKALFRTRILLTKLLKVPRIGNNTEFLCGVRETCKIGNGVQYVGCSAY